jgi:hypothetical protein
MPPRFLLNKTSSSAALNHENGFIASLVVCVCSNYHRVAFAVFSLQPNLSRLIYAFIFHPRSGVIHQSASAACVCARESVVFARVGESGGKSKSIFQRWASIEIRKICEPLEPTRILLSLSSIWLTA